MARKKGKGRSRRFRKYLKGQIDHVLSLSGLGTKDVTSTNVGDVLVEQAWLSSVKLIWEVDGGTATVDDGPVMVGVAHSDYTSAEIEEWIENLASWDSGDMIGQEVGRRRIRRAGIIHIGEATTTQVVLNDGKPIRTKCGWQLNTGQTVKVWAYNVGASAFGVTDPILHAEGHANLWPN